ncbi:MAG: phosphatase PAP2 family protein [Chitinophagales bacterium]
MELLFTICIFALMEALLTLDYWLFDLLNGVWHNALFDQIMPLLRNQYFWPPLYLFLLVFLGVNYPKQAVWIILGLIITLLFSDQISSGWFKPFFQRSRPCYDMSIIDTVRLLKLGCGGRYGFVSSHAANHFAIATYLVLLFRMPFWGIGGLTFLWAASISYAQIYVGVHFPFDILVGAILGSLLGAFMQRFIKRFILPL